MSLGRVLLVMCLLIPFARVAVAQNNEFDIEIEQSQSSGLIRELRVQASAEVPKAGNRQELAIFYHKRGIANYRLGDYNRAAEDLRLALDNTLPNGPGSGDWGSRYRIQNDLANAYDSRGNYASLSALWANIAIEYRQTSLQIYHYSQLRIMDIYRAFGQWAEAEKAWREAEATLLLLRRSSVWANSEFNIMNSHATHAAGLLMAQGRYLDAEREYRASLDNGAGKIP